MEVKLKKLLPLIGALCIAAASSAFAQGSYGSDNAMQSGQQETYQRGTFREITPSAGPRVANGADVFITANFIYWKSYIDGFTHSARKVPPVPSILPGEQQTPLEDKQLATGEDWAPGFKVGLGLNMAHDGWDLFTQYTWLRPDDSNSMRTKGPAIFDPDLQAPTNFLTPIIDEADVEITALAGVPTRVTSVVCWDLNVIDLELGRNFYLSQFLTARPFIGLKGTWQDQEITNRVFNDDNLELYRLNMDLEQWGIGIRGGLNLSFYMTKNWSIYGNFAWSALYVDKDDFKRSDELGTVEGSFVPIVQINPTFQSVKSILELELGFRWQVWFSDDNYHFSVQAGWEEQVWVNWWNYPSLDQRVEHDMIFHGLDLKFRFDF